MPLLCNMTICTSLAPPALRNITDVTILAPYNIELAAQYLLTNTQHIFNASQNAPENVQ